MTGYEKNEWIAAVFSATIDQEFVSCSFKISKNSRILPFLIDKNSLSGRGFQWTFKIE